MRASTRAPRTNTTVALRSKSLCVHSRPLTGLAPKTLRDHSSTDELSFFPFPPGLHSLHLPTMYLFSIEQNRQRYTELIRNVTGKLPNWVPERNIGVSITSLRHGRLFCICDPSSPITRLAILVPPMKGWGSLPRKTYTPTTISYRGWPLTPATNRKSLALSPIPATIDTQRTVLAVEILSPRPSGNPKVTMLRSW